MKIAASKLVMFGVDAHPARVWVTFFMSSIPTTLYTMLCYVNPTFKLVHLKTNIDRVWFYNVVYDTWRPRLRLDRPNPNFVSCWVSRECTGDKNQQHLVDVLWHANLPQAYIFLRENIVHFPYYRQKSLISHKFSVLK